MYSPSIRGTEVAMTEGQWLLTKLPECSAPKTQMMASRLMHTLLIYPTTLCISIMFMTSLNYVMIICFPLPVGKTLCMHRGALPTCLHTCQHPHQTNLTVPIATHELTCKSHILNFKPVTYIQILCQ